jgi:hypothetical protein
MKLSEDLTQMASNNKIVISGKQGEELLGFFREAADLVNSNE